MERVVLLQDLSIIGILKKLPVVRMKANSLPYGFLPWWQLALSAYR